MSTTANGKPLLTELPPHEPAQWQGVNLLNKREGVALWGGKGDVPAIGAYVDIAGKGNEIATVLGYFIDGGWLMLWCKRHSDGKTGDLAGSEIRED